MADVKTLLTDELNRLKTAIQQKMAATGVKASGATAQSLRVTVSGNEGTLWGSPHLRQLEHGRGPGHVPSGFFGIIEKWVRDKGISADGYAPKGRDASKMTSDQKVRSLAGAIAYTIMTRGTVLYRSGVPRDIYTEALNESLERLSTDVGIYFADQIQTINDKYKKE